MVEGVRSKTQADIGISTTGISGPNGGTNQKPLGLVYIGLSNKNISKVKKNTKIMAMKSVGLKMCEEGGCE